MVLKLDPVWLHFIECSQIIKTKREDISHHFILLSCRPMYKTVVTELAGLGLQAQGVWCETLLKLRLSSHCLASGEDLALQFV